MPKNNSVIDIIDILDDYSSDIQEAITQDAQAVAKQGASKLKTTSPRRTGDYQKGWKVKTTKGRYSIECTIHNATNWQLTHLLEKPHATRNGGVTIPKVHIQPVEQECINTYEKNVERIIQNGG